MNKEKLLEISHSVAVLDAAKKWWEMSRPAAWNEADHLLHPAVNMSTTESQNLARCVADLVRFSESQIDMFQHTPEIPCGCFDG